jgi:hypothetical protein
MCVAQWIELSVGALNKEGIPKLAGCLKHQFQHLAHFVLYYSFSQHSSESLCVWLNGLSSMLGPSVTRGFQSWLDA